jgi:hypothetical protein
MAGERTILIIVCIILIGILLWWKCGGNTQKAGLKEGFVTTGSMQHLGAIIPDGKLGDYELINRGTVYDSIDQSLAATDFAELVDCGDQAVQPINPELLPPRPFERLQNLSDSYFPTIASKALPFSQASAKPLYHHHSVNLPRVNIKGKLYEMNLAEAIRGTVPVNYDPNVSLIASSQYRNEDVFNPGFMTQSYSALYSKLTGSYKNIPVYISGEGVSPGCGGMGVEAIYDS